MTDAIVEEMAAKVATRLAIIGFGLMKGIVFQIAPDYDPKAGTLLQGVVGFPFVSLSSVLAEQFIIGESTNVSAAVVRTISVALIADKAIVEKNPGVYSKYRENGMRVCHTHRFGGSLASDPGACIFHATVRPNSPIQQSSWQNHAKFVSSFDVLFQTDEPNTIT
jgi:hypothetical protein